MRTIKSLGVSPRLLALATLISFTLHGEAFAHAHLTSEIPTASSTVARAPTELRLKFSEGIELQFTTISVTGPNKTAIKIGALSLDPKDRTLVIVPLADSLSAGKYTVDWHAVSTDTHKTNGSYTFTVRP